MSDNPHSSEHHKPIRVEKKKRTALVFVLLASVAVHIAIGAVFGVVSVVRSVTSPPPEFEALVEEPPMPPPAPPPTARSTQRSMPRPEPLAVQNPLNMNLPAIEINLTDMVMGASGRGGGGLGDGLGAAMSSLRLTDFGFDTFVEGSLDGKLYDLKQRPNRQPREFLPQRTMIDFIREWSRGGRLRRDILDRNFFSPELSLFATHFIFPGAPADAVPRAYNVEGVIQPTGILIHYSGTFIAPESGRFRFAGRADDVLIVSLRNRIVFDGSWLNTYTEYEQQEPSDPNRILFGVNRPKLYGDWINFRAGERYPIEVVVGEDPGGQFGFYLLLQKEGESPRIFTTRQLTPDERQRLMGINDARGLF
jgi:hypothetical protein